MQEQGPSRVFLLFFLTAGEVWQEGREVLVAERGFRESWACMCAALGGWGSVLFLLGRAGEGDWSGPGPERLGWTVGVLEGRVASEGILKEDL